MDKLLITKIIGKKDAVDLDDSVYNLRDVCDELRNIIILNLPIDEEFKARNRRRLNAIDGIVKPISEKLKSDDYIQGYTNSKKYLLKYVEDISTYIEGVLSAMEPLNIKDFTYYTNMLMDLVLVY
ncbi:hypothetical protein H8S20_06735 [Clostridium sp. NSJ-6]|uniref:Uncharacterized protein n=1 Tax=Clostridium hominis TaxID=2763036 RepID=A0ABR7DB21_9CLOT|nr:hypothetical protein [Clostridium hominis]MBC5628592.1 hypothetical protein [Clostridium hominis]MDU2670725.1 hypothetical protein [Clostridium sp.]